VRSASSSWAQLSDDAKEQRAEEIFCVVKAIVKWALILFVVFGTIAMVLLGLGGLY
jgi:hypothetical protein